MHKILRAKSQEPRAKSQEPRAKSQEPRAKSQEPRATSELSLPARTVACTRRPARLSLAGGPSPAPDTRSPALKAGPARGRRRAAAGLAFVPLLVVLTLLGGVAPVEAQTVTLVSNTGKAVSGTARVGNNMQAQSFLTGSNTAGYDFASIVLDFSDAGAADDSNWTVTVRADSSGDPSATVLYTLTNPDLVTGLNEFSAPDGATLDTATTYWVVAVYSGLNSQGADWERVLLTDGLDDGAADGWNISVAYKSDLRISPDGWAVVSTSRALQMQVKGSAKTATAMPTGCATDDLWCALLTVGTNSGNTNFGYNKFPSRGSVVPRTFTYRTATIGVNTLQYLVGSTLRFDIETDSGTAPADGLLGNFNYVLHVGDKQFAIDRPGTDTNWDFANPGLSWSADETVTVRLRLADTTAPTLLTATVNGTSLVLTYDEALAPAASLVNTPFTVKKTVGGTEEDVTLSGTSPSISGATVTLTLATAVVSTDTDVKVSYAKPDSGTDNTLVDANGNEVATFTDQAVTNNTAAVVVAPTITGLAVTSTPDAGDTYDTDETIEISVTFSAAVDVRGTPSLTFSMGNSGETVSTDAAYASGTGTTVLVFAYTVQFGDVDNNGIFISNDSDFTGRGAIALGSNGVIVAKDTETAANLALTVGRGSKPNHKVDGATNTGAATVTSVSLTSTPPYFTGDVIEVSVVFSEAVTVDTTDGTPSHQIGIDPRGARDAPYVSGSGTTTLVFRYTVETEDQDDDGVFLRDGATDGALELNMGSITADDVAAVVDAYGGRARHDDHTVNVEPTITAIAVTSDPANGTAYDTNEKIEISVTFSAAVDVTGTGTPSLAFNLGNSGSSVRTAAPYDRGSGTDTLVFAYTVQVGDEDDNGIFLYNDTNSDLGGDGVISLSTSMIVAKDTTTAANIAFASGGGLQASHKVDGTSAATVTSFLLTSTPPVETGYVTGDTIEISVVFSEAVTVDTTDGTPSHQIGIDPRGARDAPYVSGSGTTTLVFRYTVETEDQDDDGVFLRDGATDGALELNMGSITADDVAAVVDAYGGRGRQDAHKVNTQPRITALRVVSTPVLEDDTYGVDEEIRFEVEFDQVVVVSGLPRFELGIPPPEDREFADYDGGSGTATLLFVYVVQTTDVDSDGVYTGFSPAVELTGGSTIQGLGERDAVLTHSITPENHAGHKVDGSPMTVNTAPVAANDSVATGAGEAVTIDVLSNDRDAEDDALTVAAVTTPTSGSAAPNADNTRVVYTPSSGFTGTVRFTYTVSDGAATHSLDSLTVSTATVIVTVGAVSVGTGICGRTPAVRDEILRVLTLAVSPGYTGTCAGVTADWLARATYLEFQTDDGRVTSLRRGDFAGLTGVRRLSFFRQPLASLPAGVFDGLTSLRSLNLEGGQLASLSPGVFDPLRGLTELVLSDNRLSSLGSGVFDGLTSLEWLDLRNNEMRSPFPLAELEKLPALTRLLTQNNPGTRYRVEALPPSVTVEQGGTTSYRVRLMRPGVWVVGTTSQGSTVRPTPPSESAGVSVTPERLTFVPANWFRSREVTVVAAGDATLGPVRIAHRASGKFSTDAPEVRVQVVPATARATATAEDAPATIAGAPVVSDPGADGAWTPGEAVEVTLTFSETVTVDTTNGTPAIGLQLNGTAPRAAAYARGSGTGSLVFRYPVAAADGTVSSVIVPPNALLLNGGAIDGATGVAADRSHVGAARRGRRPVIDAPVRDPLTAAFEDVPESHNGTPFTFQVRFSEDVAGLSYKTLRDSAFSVTNGQVTRARRKTKGSNQGWTITVKPDSSAAVTIRLPATTDCEADDAICTSDDRPLSNSPSARIPGPAKALDFAHFAKGATITSEMVLVNAAPHPSRPAIYFYDTKGDPIPAESVVDLTGDLEVTEDGALTVLREMEPLEALTISTHGQGEPVSGSVKVLSDGPIGGLVRYSVPEIGVAGVGPGQPTSDALFPVRRQAGGIRTAAALHNLEAEALGVNCRLMSGGVALEEVEIHLEANGQTSWFIEDTFTATDTSDFGGSVRCTAPGNGRFTAVALEMDAANRIFTTLPVVPVDPPGSGNQQTTLDFAHFANGTGITSEMVFLNPSTQPSRPAVYFYDTEGNPIAPDSVVDVTGDLEITEDGGLTVWTQMEPLGVLTISTHGRGELVTGSVRVVSDGPIGGLLRFDLPGVGAGVVGASLPISEALFPVRRQEGGINTWAAIHNLESSPGLVRCDLMREGVLRDAASFPLEANGQTSWLIDQAFTAPDTSDFTGSVRCDAVGEGRFSAVALEMDPGTRTFTTLPVFPVPEMQ